MLYDDTLDNGSRQATDKDGSGTDKGHVLKDSTWDRKTAKGQGWLQASTDDRPNEHAPLPWIQTVDDKTGGFDS
jgi:hypothetical protein